MHTEDRKIDMTTGPIIQNILLFAIPLVIGNVLQQLYTTVDTLVIGNYCGTTSLAAVGTSSQPVEVLLCVFLGIGTGVSILMSQYIGAGDSEKTLELCRTASAFVWLCGIPVGVLGYFAAPLLLRSMQVPADTIAAATLYTRIVLAGAPGNIGFNMNAGILRGLGNSAASLRFLVVSCFTNIFLDLLFTAVLGMDVGGVALATAISMYVSWFFSILYIRKHAPELAFPVFTLRMSGAHLRKILGIGLPIGLNNSLFSFGHLAMQTLVNTNGSVFMAAYAVAGRISGLSSIATAGLASAATTFSGQNFGARNYGRLREGRVRIPVFAGIVTLSMGLLFLTVRMPVLRIFSQDPEVLMYAERHVTTLLLCQWMWAVFSTSVSIVNGAGLVRFTTVINLLMLWAVRIPTAYLIWQFFDGTWIMLAMPVSFSFGVISMLLYNLFSPQWNRLSGADRAGNNVPLAFTLSK